MFKRIYKHTARAAHSVAKPGDKPRGAHSDLWVAICFGLVPLVMLAIAVFLEHGELVSKESLHGATLLIGNGCSDGGACP